MKFEVVETIRMRKGNIVCMLKLQSLKTGTVIKAKITEAEYKRIETEFDKKEVRKR